MTLKGKLPSLLGAHYATGDQSGNNYRKNEEMQLKQQQCPVMDMTDDGSNV